MITTVLFVFLCVIEGVLLIFCHMAEVEPDIQTFMPGGVLYEFTAESAQEKMQVAGFSPRAITATPQESLDAVDGANRAIATVQYFQEEPQDGKDTLKVLTPETFEKELQREEIDRLPGLLEVHIAIFQTKKYPDIPSCLAVCTYRWRRMPQYRAIDALGMVRSVVGTTLVPGYQHSFVAYTDSNGEDAIQQDLCVDGLGDFFSTEIPKGISEWEGGMQFCISLKSDIEFPQTLSIQMSYLHQNGWNGFQKPRFLAPLADDFYRARGQFVGVAQKLNIRFDSSGLLVPYYG